MSELIPTVDGVPGKEVKSSIGQNIHNRGPTRTALHKVKLFLDRRFLRLHQAGTLLGLLRIRQYRWVEMAIVLRCTSAPRQTSSVTGGIIHTFERSVALVEVIVSYCVRRPICCPGPAGSSVYGCIHCEFGNSVQKGQWQR